MPRSMSTSTVSPRSRRSCGVSALRASNTGAKAVTMSESGAVTLLASSPSRHVVRMDMLSLPTGMAMPSAGHSSMPMAFTMSNRPASCPGCPAGAIQLALKRTSDSCSMGAAARLVMASPMAMRADAAGSSSAMGVRSPRAMASPT
jgi:hypothetical protein